VEDLDLVPDKDWSAQSSIEAKAVPEKGSKVDHHVEKQMSKNFTKSDKKGKQLRRQKTLKEAKNNEIQVEKV